MILLCKAGANLRSEVDNLCIIGDTEEDAVHGWVKDYLIPREGFDVYHLADEPHKGVRPVIHLEDQEPGAQPGALMQILP